MTSPKVTPGEFECTPCSLQSLVLESGPLRDGHSIGPHSLQGKIIPLFFSHPETRSPGTKLFSLYPLNKDISILSIFLSLRVNILLSLHAEMLPLLLLVA